MPLVPVERRDPIAYENLLLDREDNASWTPLVHAVQGGHIGCAKLLLSQGANANGFGWTTPLWVAINCAIKDNSNNKDKSLRKKIDCFNINLDLVRLLLRYGADPKSQVKGRKSHLLMATCKNDTVCVDLLLQYGAVIDHSSGPSLLKVALDNKNADIAINLRLKGAQLNDSDSDRYNKLLEDMHYDNKPPLCLRALCLRKINSFLDRKCDKERVGALASFGIPLSLKKLLRGDDKRMLFQCESVLRIIDTAKNEAGIGAHWNIACGKKETVEDSGAAQSL